MTTETLVIMGASLAGAKAAEAARSAGHEGRVLLIGDETAAPYERPPLSKAILRGEAAPGTARIHPEGFYREHGIELIEDHAVAIDTVSRRVGLLRGGSVAFDTAVLATGAEPRRLGVPGAELEGVHQLRTIDDSAALRDAIRRARRVAVIGAGWIGSEVAASARQMGADVVLVGAGSVPLQRVLGDRIGQAFARLHADHGVTLRLGTAVERLRGSTAVEELLLSDGRIEPADLVVVGVGVTARTELAVAAPGMRVDDGIVVDEHLESTVSDIYAAGDVARAWHPRYRRHLRVEHWANATHQGTTAGRNAAGGRDIYDRVPYFFSDQYDLGLEYLGHASADDEVVVRGDLDRREFIAFWHRDGIVTAAMAVNVRGVVADLEAIVGARTATDLSRLADPTVPLAGVLAAA
jgi:3-phenylpropionate/trans-cinnamate dioxygenase ferredoxin reductase subunit